MPTQVAEGEPGPGRDRAEWHIDQSRYADAEVEAREMIAREPDGWEGYTLLSRSLLGLGETKAALVAAREAIRKDPQAAWARVVYGNALVAAGRHLQALDEADEAERLDPDDPEVYALFFRVFWNAGRLRDCLWAAREGLRLAPTDVDLICYKGGAELWLGRPEAALRTAEEGRKHHPNSPLLHNLIGCIRRQQAGRVSWFRVDRRCRTHQRAEAGFREAVGLDPPLQYIQDNRRENLLSWRRLLVAWSAGVVLGLSVVVGLAAVAARMPAKPRDMQNALFAVAAVGALLYYVVYMLVYNSDAEHFVLRAPLIWLGVPTLPLSPRERRTAGLLWAATWAFLLAPAVALLTLTTLVPMPGR